jgi:CheY-like chemotaxis protein
VVAAPKRRGFGTAFMEESVKAHRGIAEMLSEAEGVTWTIALPLGQSVAESPSSMLPMKMEASSSDAISNSYRNTSLKGRRVLVVEDEALVAMDLVGILEQAAAKPVGPAATAADALRLIENEALDAALIDANLRGRPVDEIAAALTRRNVPFAFVTGYDRASLPPAFQNRHIIAKPFTTESVLDVIGKMSAQRQDR